MLGNLSIIRNVNKEKGSGIDYRVYAIPYRKMMK